MWLNEFKAALVLENIDRIAVLSDTMPTFSTIQEMEEAAFLVLQAKTLLEQRKQEAVHTMQQLKKNLDFLKSTQTSAPSTLNLKL